MFFENSSQTAKIFSLKAWRKFYLFKFCSTFAQNVPLIITFVSTIFCLKLYLVSWEWASSYHWISIIFLRFSANLFLSLFRPIVERKYLSAAALFVFSMEVKQDGRQPAACLPHAKFVKDGFLTDESVFLWKLLFLQQIF